MDLTAKLVQQDQFHSEILDDEVILYFSGGSRFLYLNQTAALVWSLCDGVRSAGEIIALLQAGFPESAAEIGSDVESTIEIFLQHGCLTLA